MKRSRKIQGEEMTFILNDDLPVLSIKNSSISETNKKLIKGTILKGFLKTRLISLDGKRSPFKFIQLKDENGYISPRGVDIYIEIKKEQLNNFSGENNEKDNLENVPKNKKVSKLLSIGLPAIGGVLGYQIANKKGMELTKKIAFVLGFSLLFYVPIYVYKKSKEK